MSPEPESDDIAAIEATAASWLSLRDRGMNEAETVEFMRWLQQSPQHAETFAELDAVWRDFDRVGALRPTGPATPEPDLLAPRARPRRLGWRRARWVFAAAAAAVLAWMGWPHQLNRLRPTAETTIGAFQKLDLPDGSVVQLNTDSAIRVAFSAAERRVELLRGEAHFDVAKNPARPFIVAAANVAVRAVGTAFNVRRLPAAIDVLVTEGKVQVDDAAQGGSLLPASAGRSGPAVLVQGERAVVPLAVAAETSRPAPAPAMVAVVTPPEIERTLAWQERRLEFDDTPLSEVIAEFNRYNRTKLVLADSALAARRFSGTFRADSYEPFVRLLEENFHMAVTRGDEVIELRRAP